MSFLPNETSLFTNANPPFPIYVHASMTREGQQSNGSGEKDVEIKLPVDKFSQGIDPLRSLAKKR